MFLTWVRCQCLEALAMGSVTWVQAAPNSISLWGPLCIMSKKALTPTAALHCKSINIYELSVDNVSLIGETLAQCIRSFTSDSYHSISLLKLVSYF